MCNLDMTPTLLKNFEDFSQEGQVSTLDWTEWYYYRRCASLYISGRVLVRMGRSSYSWGKYQVGTSSLISSLVVLEIFEIEHSSEKWIRNYKGLKN